MISLCLFTVSCGPSIFPGSIFYCPLRAVYAIIDPPTMQEVLSWSHSNTNSGGICGEDFRLFHLADSDRPEIAYHYHTFHKIILLLAGRAGYCVEGERYELAPGDLVVIGRGSIHRPELRQGDFYERMILYISPEFLEKNSTPDCDLAACFQQAQSRFQYVYRTGADDEISPLLTALEQAGRSEEFGAALLQRAVAVQLLVQLNRTVLARHAIPAAAGDSKIVAILQYLNLHLTEPITIDELAGRFYLSKYHMMRRFRQETATPSTTI